MALTLQARAGARAGLGSMLQTPTVAAPASASPAAAVAYGPTTMAAVPGPSPRLAPANLAVYYGIGCLALLVLIRQSLPRK